MLTDSNNDKFIVKWENRDTLSYHIEGELTYISRKAWDQYIQEIEELIGLQIVEVDNRNVADIQVYFGALEDYFEEHRISFTGEIESEKFDNWHNRTFNENKELITASYCIVPSKAYEYDRGTYNVKNLFLKSLGHLGNLFKNNMLIALDSGLAQTKFTRQDKRIVKIHYDSRIKSGMSLKEVNAVLNAMDLQLLINEKF